MPLTEKEKKELELLENPEVEFFAPTIGAVVSIFSSTFARRKERVVALRTKQRMEELGMDEEKNWQEYYRIREEEETRFDERFRKK